MGTRRLVRAHQWAPVQQQHEPLMKILRKLPDFRIRPAPWCVDATRTRA